MKEAIIQDLWYFTSIEAAVYWSYVCVTKCGSEMEDRAYREVVLRPPGPLLVGQSRTCRRKLNVRDIPIRRPDSLFSYAKRFNRSFLWSNYLHFPERWGLKILPHCRAHRTRKKISLRLYKQTANLPDALKIRSLRFAFRAIWSEESQPSVDKRHLKPKSRDTTQSLPETIISQAFLAVSTSFQGPRPFLSISWKSSLAVWSVDQTALAEAFLLILDLKKTS